MPRAFVEELGCSESCQGRTEGWDRQRECCHSGESEPSRSVSQVTDQPPLLHILALHKPSVERRAVVPSIQRTQSPFTAQKFEQIAAGHIVTLRQRTGCVLIALSTSPIWCSAVNITVMQHLVHPASQSRSLFFQVKVFINLQSHLLTRTLQGMYHIKLVQYTIMFTRNWYIIHVKNK